jgi:caa(3)-type oxidase subunit IV
MDFGGAGPMSSAENIRGEYIAVWGWLVALLLTGLAVMALPIPKFAAVVLIFGVAAVKAALVVRNYMHLKREHLFIIALVVVPVILFIGLATALIPDIAMRR